ncbi:MAG: LysM peptidoglycan-binding domain-containing protein [Chloroflexaceae bacterium]|nr:LysM peptidoglycan-binding domain-containing protein [Chloroflexaceae bacterium]
MPQILVYLLLALALVVPVLGAILLRLMGNRLSQRGFIVVAVVLFGLAMSSTLVLASSDVSSLRMGNVTLLLPNRGNADVAAAAAAQAGPPTDGTSGPLVQVPSEVPTPETAPTAVATTTSAATATAATAATAQTATAEPSATVAASPSPEVTATPTAAPTEAAAAGAERRYTVRSGDTLSEIAERFSVSTASIIRANNLTQRQAENLQIGQELVIPPPPTPTPAGTGPSPTPASSQRTYTVRSGDTLGAIAQRFGVTVAALREANNLTVAQGNSLRIGQVLIIPEP